MGSKRASIFTPATVRSSKVPKISHVDESHAVIVNAAAAVGRSSKAPITLSSEEAEEAGIADEESVRDSEDADKENDEGGPSAVHKALPNGVKVKRSSDCHAEMNAIVRPSPSKEAPKETDDAMPSFGDLIVAKSTKPISIVEALPSVESNALVATETSKPIALPSAISLSTVLSQALRTNDNNLLESCFHNNDTQIIRSTIQRIESSLAGILIQKLAERLSSRPGRYGHLLVWVQWICVAHGGAIGGQPDVLSKIKTLYMVLDQRSKALESLLRLKGKLDMLDAQLSLRKQQLSDGDPAKDADGGHVVYIEGEEDGDSSDDDAAMGHSGNVTYPPSRTKAKNMTKESVSVNEEESEGDEDVPMTNGVVAEVDESDFDSEDDEEGPFKQGTGDLIDDEAEQSDEDSHPSAREDSASEEEDVDDDDEDSEMDDFIDDGSIEEAESACETLIDETPEKPPPKRKRRQ